MNTLLLQLPLQAAATPAAGAVDEETSFSPLSGAVHLPRLYQGEKRFLLLDSVKIACSDVGFPINVYGTVIAGDSLDKKCVYLFRRHRKHCQLINSEDNLLILTGLKRGLVLISAIYFEMDLKIKGDQGKKDKQLGNGFLKLDVIPRLSCGIK